MRRVLSAVVFPLSLAAACALAPIGSPLAAQGLMADVHGELNAVQKKIIDLATAMPESAYGWRPSAGVRTMGEVFKHVATDNYLIPIMTGTPAPAATGISGTDMKSVEAYEKRAMTKTEVISELTTSFNHLHRALLTTTDANLSEKVKFFGQDMSRQKIALITLTHLHEHLGQSIAYARSNNVVPPWSK